MILTNMFCVVQLVLAAGVTMSSAFISKTKKVSLSHRLRTHPLSATAELKYTGDDKVDRDEGTGIYIHIPYCRRRCSYCDFAIIPIGDTKRSEISLSGFSQMDESYRDAITTEIDLLKQSLSSVERGEIRLSSIYFGGGTPSLAPIQTIQSIIDHILSPDGVFILNENAEVTIEMDPGTFTVEHLDALSDIGFNRISLGVQSFNDTILEGIGRVHRLEDIVQSIQCIETVFGGEPNYSIDLISGLPGLSLDLWNETIQNALSLKPAPNHISVYDLQIEEGTSFGKWYPDRDEDDDYDYDEEKREDGGTQNYHSVAAMTATASNMIVSGGVLPLPPAEDCASMYKHASEFLRSNGFEHYEISSYARIKDITQGTQTLSSEIVKSYRSQHNQIYWRLDGEWFAVGLSATSFINRKRFARPRTLADYNKWVSDQSSLLTDSVQGEGEVRVPYDWLPSKRSKQEDIKDTEEEILLDTIMTRLRTKDGLDLDWILAQNNGTELLKLVLKGAELGIDLGLANIVEGEDNSASSTLRLSDPEGFLFSNSVISSIFAELP